MSDLQGQLNKLIDHAIDGIGINVDAPEYYTRLEALGKFILDHRAEIKIEPQVRSSGILQWQETTHHPGESASYGRWTFVVFRRDLSATLSIYLDVLLEPVQRIDFLGAQDCRNAAEVWIASRETQHPVDL